MKPYYCYNGISNPTVNKLQLNPQHIEIKSLSIYTLFRTKDNDLYDVPESIDVSALQSGLYVLEFVTDKGKTFKKFIKSKVLPI